MYKRAFSILEVIIILTILSFAFMPMYNLFRSGTQTTFNTINDVTATNYASDLLNLIRDLPVDKISKGLGVTDKEPKPDNPFDFEDDDKINEFLKRAGLPAIDKVESPFLRKMSLTYYKGKDSTAIIGSLLDKYYKRGAVKNYLIEVTVNYPRGLTDSLDKVTLIGLAIE